MEKIIKNVKIPSDDTITENNDLIIENGIIKYIGHLGDEHLWEKEIIDGEGLYMIPGFIDCHTHGFNGYCAEDSADKLRKMAVEYARRGITGFYATLGPESNQTYFKIFNEYRKAFAGEYSGARFLGLHIEGPYLNVDKKGGFDGDKFRQIIPGEVKELVNEGRGLVKLVTVAPELNGAIEAIDIMTKAGITVSMGHSMATYEEAAAGVQAGITHATHTYNAMRPFNHRETGILGASMLNGSVYCELIMDCVHVSKEAMKILISLKGAEKIIAVSDGDVMCGSGCPDQDMGDYIIKDGAVYLKDGTLYGSTKDLADHMRTLVFKLNMGISDAVKMTSTNCAEHMGLNKGRIEPGYDADFNLVDSSFKVCKTFVSGQMIES